VLKFPLTTESAMKKIEDNNTLVFIVETRANKSQIKAAVRKLYDIQVRRRTRLGGRRACSRARRDSAIGRGAAQARRAGGPNIWAGPMPCADVAHAQLWAHGRTDGHGDAGAEGCDSWVLVGWPRLSRRVSLSRSARGSRAMRTRHTISLRSRQRLPPLPRCPRRRIR
jgi:ribosomal protein L23